MAQLWLWTKTRTKTVTLFGFSMYACGFSVSQMRQFGMFTWRYFFFFFFLQKSASSVSWSQTHAGPSVVQAYTQHGPITIDIDYNGFFFAHFRRKVAQLCLCNKIRTKQWLVLGASDFQCMRADFLCPKCDKFACLHNRQDQNELYLKRLFFLPKSASAVSWSGPSVVQAYTQPYSFGGRIKLIICQIRHELCVTIHDISTSWKKKL